MTRKRFVKLMMARGYDRNGANKLADEARRTNQSYQAYDDFYNSFERTLSDAAYSVGEPFPKVVELVAKVARAFGESARVFAEKFSEIMFE